MFFGYGLFLKTFGWTLLHWKRSARRWLGALTVLLHRLLILDKAQFTYFRTYHTLLPAVISTDGTYLGSANLPQYNNIRKWLAVDGVLYTAVGNTGGGGSVLRWRGDAANPFQLEVVGRLDNAGANLAAHEGRLFVTTWPDQRAILQAGAAPRAMAGLWMSPPIPLTGLTGSHAGTWEKAWQADEPVNRPG